MAKRSVCKVAGMDFCYHNTYNSKNIFDLFGVKLSTHFIQFAPLNNYFLTKIASLTHKMLKMFCEVMCIFTTAKNHTNNFADTSFGPDYCILNGHLKKT